jgi:hypothetical protein
VELQIFVGNILLFIVILPEQIKLPIRLVIIIDPLEIESLKFPTKFKFELDMTMFVDKVAVKFKLDPVSTNVLTFALEIK